MTALGKAVSALGAAAAWGLFEAGWVRLAKQEVRIEGLPAELAGLRIAHLSDFHLGLPSRGSVALERAADWVAERRPELVLISGDLLARPGGERQLRRALERFGVCFAVLGNHDYAVSRDPFSSSAAPRDLSPATLLRDEGQILELRGRRVQIVGVDPRSYLLGKAKPARFADPGADLRILVCHFPRVIDALPPGAFHLVLAGHVHDGQICVPFPGGKLRLAHIGAAYTTGLYRRPAGVLHVSPGLGTTFVPFRFLARPEATELVLQSS